MIPAIYRRVRAVVVIVAILIATALVSTIAVDLGPTLRARAEREGSNGSTGRCTSAGLACRSAAAAS